MLSPEPSRRAQDGPPANPAASDREKLGWVIQLYRLVLGRQPDAGGLTAHFERLHQGADLAALAPDFLESDEFRARRLSAPDVFDLYAAAYGSASATAVKARHESRLTAPASLAAQLTALIKLEPFPPGQDEIAAILPGNDEGYRLWTIWNAPAAAPPLGSPTISVLILASGAPEIGRTIASILKAGAASEIVIVGAPSPAVLWAASRAGPRVRLTPRWPFTNPSHLIRKALDQCKGDLVCVMAPGDRLHPEALKIGTAAFRIQDPPALVYVDEDAIGPNGERRAPWFKSSWDQEVALTLDQIGRGWFAPASLLREAAADAEPTTGSLAHAMQHLVRSRARPGAVIHLPTVLYHRAEPPAPAWSASAGAPAPAVWPRVTVIIPTRDRADLLSACIKGLLEQTDYPDLELIIVDNDSREAQTRELFASLAEDSRVRVLAYPHPFNWGAVNNFAAARATGEVLLLLNNDIEVIEPGWLREMVAQAVRPEVGVVGATLLYPDHTIQHAGIVLGPEAAAGHVGRGQPADAQGPGDRFRVARSASAVTGACLAIRREVFRDLGGVESAALRVTWSDTDLCLKAWAGGYRVLVTPHARLVHVELATRGADTTPEAAARFSEERAWMRDRWGSRLNHDPYFSPHVDAETGALRLLGAPPGQT